MHLGIDASNIKLGGGLTHLVEVLSAANPYAHGFDTVSVFGSSALLKQLPVRPWLNRAGDPLLDSGYIKWWKWLKEKRLKVAPFLVDVLFTPGASPFPINSSIPLCGC